MAETAVVILNWNGLGFLKQFLAGVIENSAGEGVGIWIIDNNSSDGSCSWVRQVHPEVNIIELDKNHGFAGGYNHGLKKIKAKYYVLLNSDIEVTADWLRPMVGHLEKNPDVASCQPKILSYNNKEYFEYAGAAGGFIDKLGYPLCRGRMISVTEKDLGQYNDSCDIFWSSGACMLVRAEAWEKCGGFDYDFFAHMEEIDLCWRFQRSGYRVSYIPESLVYHVGGGTLPYTSPFKTFLNFRNSLYLLYKNLPDENFRSKMFWRRMLDGVAALFFLVKGQFKSVAAVWNAHMAFYRHLGQLKEKRKMVKGLGSEIPGNILNKLIVLEFYVKRKRTFTSLNAKI